MRAHDSYLAKLIKLGETSFYIPVFQRNYTWDIENCQQLFSDLETIALTQREHFIGNIVYVSTGTATEANYNIIDGQQRITSVMLFLKALHDLTDDSKMQKQIRNGYLMTSDEDDDILLSVRAPVGPTNLAPCKVCIGRGLTAIRPSEVLLTRYVLLFFRYFEAQLASQGTGTTFKAITQDVVKNLEIPIPPIPEQKRIVARIEELSSQLDAGVETLKKTKAQLLRYRRSVIINGLEDEKMPIIGINDEDRAPAKSFSLIHELVHLLNTTIRFFR